MQVTIQPSVAKGVMKAPPSKSMAHRLLICAGIAKGESIIRGLAPSEDVLATMDCLRALGAQVRYEDGTAYVKGIGDAGRFAPATLPCRECGSTLRFFIPICLTTGSEMYLTGSRKLLSRNMLVYESLAKEKGYAYAAEEDGIRLCGRMEGGTYQVTGDVSSQFISGLLFTLSRIPGENAIHVIPPEESKPYIDLTVSALNDFGANIRMAESQDGGLDLKLTGGTLTGREGEVEGDYSNAAFFEVYNHMGGSVVVNGLRSDSLQGDRVYREHFAALDAGSPVIDIRDCPDLGPILMAFAALKNGALFTGTRRLKIKESDRGTAMAAELFKMGIHLEVSEDTIRVESGTLHAPDAVLDGHNDHRIVMALATLLTVTGGSIRGCEAVRKSLPDYFDLLGRLGITYALTD